MDNCIFCKKRILGEDGFVYETKNFYIKIGKGIICGGHCMIITKDHYKCMGDISEELIDEYLNLKKSLINFITKNFYRPFIVENGVFMQSVYHAHTHFIPRKSEYFEEVDLLEDIVNHSAKKNNIKLENIDNFRQVMDFFKEDEEYLYFEQDGVIKLLRSIKYENKKKEIIEDFSYRNFFDKLGLVGVRDWRFLTEEDLIVDNQKISKTSEMFKKFTQDTIV
jgi:diadenosine tetraphosphate (Ap4A) HIT family hydrolase